MNQKRLPKAPTVGIICPLHLELNAVFGAFKEPPTAAWIPQHDANSDFVLCYHGYIGEHYAVAMCIGDKGFQAASIRRQIMQREFPNLEHNFLVGLAGGVPWPEGNVQGEDIRLGDVVVATSIIAADFGKWKE